MTYLVLVILIMSNNHFQIGRQPVRMGISTVLLWPVIVLLVMLIVRIGTFNTAREVMGLDTMVITCLFCDLVQNFCFIMSFSFT